MPALFDFQSDYRVFCAYCQESSEGGCVVAAGGEIPWPCLPTGGGCSMGNRCAAGTR